MIAMVRCFLVVGLSLAGPLLAGFTGGLGVGPDGMRLSTSLGPRSATVVGDSQAPDGKAARQPGDNTSWSIQWPLPADQLRPGRRYELRVLVRVDRKGTTGNGFAAGVYRPGKKTYPIGTKRIPVAQISTDGYAWISIGEFEPQAGDLAYVAPEANPEVSYVYTARIELVPVRALRMPRGVDGWANALKPKGEPSQLLTFAKDGRTDYVIVQPAEPTPQETRAAELLSAWLEDMTDAPFPIVSDASQPKAREICVGMVRRPGLLQVTKSTGDLGDEGYLIAVSGERVILLGGAKRGPLYAALALLEEDLGCRWYTRYGGNRVSFRPTLKVGVVPRHFTPVFYLRDPFYHDAFDANWSLMNRTNSPNAKVDEALGGRMDYVPGWFVHTYAKLVPEKEYLAEHPEYFLLNTQGKRTAQNLCPTNPEVVRLATERALAALRKHPDAELISISKNDIRGVCQCERCRELNEREGSNSAGPLTLVNAVANAVAKEFPDVLVSTLAYHDTVQPPKTLRPAKNVVVRLCTDTCMWKHPFRPAMETEVFREALTGWAAIHDRIAIWDYSVNFGNYMQPWPSFHAIAENLRAYAQNHVVSVMIQGAYQSPGNERELMRSWVFAKLLWDPSRECWPLIQDFIRGYYGVAAPPIERYNRMLYDAGSENRSIDEIPDFLATSKRLFDEARRLAAADEELGRRVELAGLPVLQWELNQGLAAFNADGSQAAERERLRNLLDTFSEVSGRHGIRNVSERDSVAKWCGKIRRMLSDPAPARLHATTVDGTKAVVYYLDATWKFRKDDGEKGEEQGWSRPDLDEAGWSSFRTDLGVGWEKQGSKGDGLGWFRKTVAVPKELTQKHLYMCFGAVDESAWVYIDGQLRHTSTPDTTGLEITKLWATPFRFDAAEWLKPGQRHQVTVRVHDAGGMGGIYMPVLLVGSDKPLTAEQILVAAGVANPYL
jgi:hypothetical protein